MNTVLVIVGRAQTWKLSFRVSYEDVDVINCSHQLRYRWKDKKSFLRAFSSLQEWKLTEPVNYSSIYQGDSCEFAQTWSDGNRPLEQIPTGEGHVDWRDIIVQQSFYDLPHGC